MQHDSEILKTAKKLAKINTHVRGRNNFVCNLCEMKVIITFNMLQIRSCYVKVKTYES